VGSGGPSGGERSGQQTEKELSKVVKQHLSQTSMQLYAAGLSRRLWTYSRHQVTELLWQKKPRQGCDGAKSICAFQQRDRGVLV